MKESRWYEVEGETLYVYDSPVPMLASSVSIVGLSDITYYRNNFRLRKVTQD